VTLADVLRSSFKKTILTNRARGSSLAAMGTTKQTRVVGGVTFEVLSWGTGLVTFSADLTEAQYAERAEVWAGLLSRWWEVDAVTHAIDPEIVDAGNVYLILRCRPESKTDATVAI